MAANSRMSKLSEKEDECVFTWKLFTGWDYMIGNAETAHNKVASTILGFKEALLEEAEKQREERNWRIITVRILVNITVVFLLASSAYAVVFAVQRSGGGGAGGGGGESDSESTVFSRNATTIIINIVNFLFPLIFELIGMLERYHPRKTLRLQLGRIMLLNLMNLYSLIFSTFSKIHVMTQELDRLRNMTRNDIDGVIGAVGVGLSTSSVPVLVPRYPPRCESGASWCSTIAASTLAVSLTSSAFLSPLSTAAPTHQFISRPATTTPGNGYNFPFNETYFSTANKLAETQTSHLFDATSVVTFTKASSPINGRGLGSHSTQASNIPTAPSADVPVPSSGTPAEAFSTSETPYRSTGPSLVSASTLEESQTQGDKSNTNGSTSSDVTADNCTTCTSEDSLDKPPLPEADVNLPTQSTEATSMGSDNHGRGRKVGLFKRSVSGYDSTTNHDPFLDFSETVNTSVEIDLWSTSPSVPNTFDDVSTTSKTSAIDNWRNVTYEETEGLWDLTMGTTKDDLSRQEELSETKSDDTINIGSPSTHSDNNADNSDTDFDVERHEPSPGPGPGPGPGLPTLTFETPALDGVSTTESTLPNTKTPAPATSSSAKSVQCPQGHCLPVWKEDEEPPVVPTASRYDLETRRKLRSNCWETMFGQELVKITVMDLVMTILSTLSVDFFRAVFVRIMNNCWCWDLEKKFPQYGDFKVAENILHLVNNQGMVWMGMFFSPGLALINLVKLVIMMYLRSWAVLTCNVPHEVVFRASRSNNFYFALLLTMLFLCVLPVGYAVVWLKPSWHCGPFSMKFSPIYTIFTKSLRGYVPQSLHIVLDYVASPGIVIPLLLLLSLVIYYLVSLTNSLREANDDLKIQLRRERTEERRRMFQLVERRKRGAGAGSSADLGEKWKKLLPPPAAAAPSTRDEEGATDPAAATSRPAKPDNAARRKELLSRLLKHALRKSSATSDEESGGPGVNGAVDVPDPDPDPDPDPYPDPDADGTDAEQADSLPEDGVVVGVVATHARPSRLTSASETGDASRRVNQPPAPVRAATTPSSHRRRRRQREDSGGSLWSDNIPEIRISKTESTDCVVDVDQDQQDTADADTDTVIVAVAVGPLDLAESDEKRRKARQAIGRALLREARRRKSDDSTK